MNDTPEYILERRKYQKEWYDNRSPEQVEAKRQSQKEWRDKNPQNSQYKKKWRENKLLDPEYVERERDSRRKYDKTHAKAKRNREVQERKQHIFNLLGGKCVVCGYNEHLCAIDMHETEKLFKPTPSSFLKSNVKFQQLLDGIHVLIPLCANCHRVYHKGLVKLPDIQLDLL